MSTKRPTILRARKGVDWTPFKKTVSLFGSKENFPQFFTSLGLPTTPYNEWIDFRAEDEEKFGLGGDSVGGAYVYRHPGAGFRVICLLFPEIKRSDAFGILKKFYKKGELADTLFALTKEDFSEVWLAIPIPQDKRLEVRALPIDVGNPKVSILETLYETQKSLKKFLEHNKDFSSFEILKILWDKFNRAPVTGRFYKDLEEQAKEIETETKRQIAPDRDRRRFSLLLLTRVMFVYFLQKKKWIEGKEEILNELLQKSGTEGESTFYEKYLKTLFFQVLNEKIEKRSGLAQEYSTTPYLNGGLFSQTELELQYKDITLTNRIFSALFEEFLDKYRFIVTEETPEFTTVSVDPEILGGVFEEIIQGKERKEEGAYYTPKEVVLFMTRNALFFWLRKKAKVEEDKLLRLIFDDDSEGLTQNDKAEILPLIKGVKVIDPAVGSGAFLQGMLLELERLRKRLDEEMGDLERRKGIIRDNLYGVDIDDIAVWLCEIRLWLNLVEVMEGDIKDIPPLPNLDHKIKKGDSLLQDVMDVKRSLLSLQLELFTPELNKRRGIVIKLLPEIADLEKEYIKGGPGAREIAEKIKELRQQLVKAMLGKENDVSFHWEIHFPEVFAHEGFDIAIMNPPYVRSQDIGKLEFFSSDYKKKLSSHYLKATGTSDLYVFFYHRLKDILKKEGIAVMVTANAWLDTDYGEKLQKYLLENFRLLVSYEPENERWFGAEVNTDIFIFEQANERDGNDLSEFVTFEGSLKNYIVLQQKSLSHMMRNILREGGERIGNGFLYQGSDFRIYSVSNDELMRDQKWGKYLRAPKIFWKILKRSEDKLTSLKEVAEVETYLNTGGADAFFYVSDVTKEIDERVLVDKFSLSRDEIERTNLQVIESRIKKNKKTIGYEHFLVEKEYLSPLLKTSREIDMITLQSHRLQFRVLAINEPVYKIKKKKVWEYIKWGKKRGFNKASGRKSKGERWYVLPQQAFEGATILCCRSAQDERDIIFVYNPFRVISNRFYRIKPFSIPEKVMVIVLNSHLFVLFKELWGRRSLGGGALDTEKTDIEKIPFPREAVLKDYEKKIIWIGEKFLNREIAHMSLEVSQPDRRELDSIILEALGFTDPKEREEVLAELYDAVTTLVRRRLQKAKTIMGEEE